MRTTIVIASLAMGMVGLFAARNANQADSRNEKLDQFMRLNRLNLSLARHENLSQAELSERNRLNLEFSAICKAEQSH